MAWDGDAGLSEIPHKILKTPVPAVPLSSDPWLS